jgi:hypothetical protein
MGDLTEEQRLSADIKTMSDNHLIDRAAGYNLILRRGRKLESDGRALTSKNIVLYVMCQNELYARINRRIERETDRDEGLI